MRHEKTRQSIINVSNTHKIPRGEVLDIINSIFEFQVESMRNDTDGTKDIFPTLRIPYWGIFYVPKDLRKKLKEYYIKKNATISTEELQTGDTTGSL